LNSILLKKACRKNGRPLVSHTSIHGFATHDFINLERRHHHAVDTKFIIFISFYWFRLQIYGFSFKLQTFWCFFFKYIIFPSYYKICDRTFHHLNRLISILSASRGVYLILLICGLSFTIPSSLYIKRCHCQLQIPYVTIYN